jgi:hypothetical protein
MGLRDHLESNRPLEILGVDLDENLIDRAKEKAESEVRVTFSHPVIV